MYEDKIHQLKNQLYILERKKRLYDGQNFNDCELSHINSQTRYLVNKGLVEQAKEYYNRFYLKISDQRELDNIKKNCELKKQREHYKNWGIFSE